MLWSCGGCVAMSEFVQALRRTFTPRGVPLVAFKSSSDAYQCSSLIDMACFAFGWLACDIGELAIERQSWLPADGTEDRLIIMRQTHMRLRVSRDDEVYHFIDFWETPRIVYVPCGFSVTFDSPIEFPYVMWTIVPKLAEPSPVTLRSALEKVDESHVFWAPGTAFQELRDFFDTLPGWRVNLDEGTPIIYREGRQCDVGLRSHGWFMCAPDVDCMCHRQSRSLYLANGMGVNAHVMTQGPFDACYGFPLTDRSFDICVIWNVNNERILSAWRDRCATA